MSSIRSRPRCNNYKNIQLHSITGSKKSIELRFFFIKTMFILKKTSMNIGERALISRTTQLSRDALTRALDGTDVHLTDPCGQLLFILDPPIIFVR